MKRGMLAGPLVALLMISAACSAGTSGSGASTLGPGLASIGPSGSARATLAAVPNRAGQSLDACSLLTDDEVERITERTIATKQEGPVMGIFDEGCSWELDPGRDDLVGWTIDVGARAPGGRSYFDTFLSFPEDTEPVSGLGDVAVVDDAGGITAVKGDTLVSVFVIAFSADDEAALTRELTETALAHVP